MIVKPEYYQNQVLSWHTRTPSLSWEEEFLSLNINVCGKKILDLGCGPGYYGQILSKHGAIVYGYDKEDECLKSASEKEPKYYQLIKGDILSIETLSEKFDIVFMRYVIHHIDNKLRQEVINNVRKLLKPKGLLIIQTSFLSDFIKHYDHMIYPKLTEKLLIHYPTKEDLEAYYQKAGLSLLQTKQFVEIYDSYASVDEALHKSRNLIDKGIGSTAWLLLDEQERVDFHQIRTRELPKMFGEGKVPRYWYAHFIVGKYEV